MSPSDASAPGLAMQRAEWLTGPATGALTRFGEPARFREGLYRVEGGSHAWMVPNGSWGENNVGVIDCGGESVLVDTCWDLARTREMLAATAPVLSRAPAGMVINTHSDGDHCWGNQLGPRARRGLPVPPLRPLGLARAPRHDRPHPLPRVGRRPE